ncbi:hypothetical protein ASJ81_17350 [Methanosarcina spelaei]|uniref:Uncharacterized protein n=1 Tax=Methanosarcina spelaei TaxID=1036679 RepID=A0A2A2HW82_9EURY|nr:hypothetical protein [Methanosarcina spelaei]PAV13568.1 hypothetical protein ASJ81_17350 [Methanosarcina spelaei]
MATLKGELNRELNRIKATQYRQRISRYGRKAVYALEPKEPLKFKPWFLQGIEYYQKEKGFTFEVLCPGLLRVKRPGQTTLLRTYKDFVREYKNDYLSKF